AIALAPRPIPFEIDSSPLRPFMRRSSWVGFLLGNLCLFLAGCSEPNYRVGGPPPPPPYQIPDTPQHAIMQFRFMYNRKEHQNTKVCSQATSPTNSRTVPIPRSSTST